MTIKLVQCMEECQFTQESLKQVFDRQFAIKDMRQSERLNFKQLEWSLRAFVRGRMESIITKFRRANLSEDDRLELGSAIANVHEYFEGQLNQLLDTVPESESQEG